MAIYEAGWGSAWGPVGPVRVYYEIDDGGTPPLWIDEDPTLVDDKPLFFLWCNPNPRPASYSVLFLNSGQRIVIELAANTPEWQRVQIPPNLQARWGRTWRQGPNYPATPLRTNK